MITDEYLIKLFNNDPFEFLNICLKISDESGKLPPFGQYVYIKLHVLLKKPLPNGAYDMLNGLEKIYGQFDVSSLLKPMKLATITDFEDELVNHFTDIATSMKKDDEEKFMGWIEFNNALANNVYFSKKNRNSNGFQYSVENTPLLFDWLTNFKTVNYQLNDNISIRLTPKGFFHILFGHVDGYLIPRKGAMVKIININSCEELFKLISDIIMHVKTELINHYQAKLGKFEKNNIVYLDHEYALNIDSKRKIISFYSVERKYIKNYN